MAYELGKALIGDGSLLVAQYAEVSQWIPMGIGICVVGAATYAARGTAAAASDMPSWDFDAAADEDVSFGFIPWPVKTLADGNGAVNYTLFWAPSDGTAGNVVWDIRADVLLAGDQVDSAMTGNAITSAAPAVADDLVVVTGFTERAILTDSVGLKIAVRRDADNASDTYAADAWLVGLRVHFDQILY